MKQSSTPGQPVVPVSGAEAFAAIQPELDAIAADQLKPITVDIAYGHAIAIAAADRIDTLIPELSQLPLFDMRNVLMIRSYAAACQHAHLLAKTPEPAEEMLPALLEEASALREDMLSSAELLARFGLVASERVAAVRSGIGHVDLASDIEQLGVLFAEVWADVATQTPVTRPMVDRAPELAYQLQLALGTKRNDASSTDDRQLTRARAFTLFDRAYDQCRRGVAFLRHDEGDADDFAPSIYAKQRKPAAPPAEPIEPEPPVATAPLPSEEVTLTAETV